MVPPAATLPASPRQTELAATEAAAPRLTFIDGLRGLAILLVLLRHVYMNAYTAATPRGADLLGLGYLGVHLFLLLSGFCVSWAYVGARPRPFQVREFAVRRAGRLLPPYYFALAVSLGLALPLSLSEATRQLAAHLTMTHNLFPGTVLALNSPFWSLALECQLYLTLPPILWGFRRFGPPRTLLVILAIQTAYRIGVAHRFGTDYNALTFVLPWGVLGRDFEFALGVWAATLIGRGSLARWPAPASAGLPWAALPLAGAGLWAKHALGVTSPLTDLCWTLAFFALLLASGRAGSGLTRLFSWPPLAALGVISYSVYLTHDPLLHLLCRHLPSGVDGPARLALLLPLLALTIGLGAAYYAFIEKPAMRFFHPARRRAVKTP